MPSAKRSAPTAYRPACKRRSPTSNATTSSSTRWASDSRRRTSRSKSSTSRRSASRTTPSNSGSTSISTEPKNPPPLGEGSVGAAATSLLREWAPLQAIDHHCHPLRRWPLTLSALDLRAAFSEALDPALAQHHVVHTAAYQGALRRIAAVLGCEPDEETILARRNAADPGAHARTLLSGTGMMLVDGGFASADTFTLPEQGAALAIPQREIVRLETLAERLLDVATTPAEWLAAIRE